MTHYRPPVTDCDTIALLLVSHGESVTVSCIFPLLYPLAGADHRMGLRVMCNDWLCPPPPPAGREITTPTLPESWHLGRQAGPHWSPPPHDGLGLVSTHCQCTGDTWASPDPRSRQIWSHRGHPHLVPGLMIQISGIITRTLGSHHQSTHSACVA